MKKTFYCLLFLLLSIGTTMKAQVTLSLTYTEKASLTTVLSGDIYTMQLNYAVSSTTGSATGVKVVVNLPDNIYDVRNFVGTGHAPVSNFVFSNVIGSKKLTITFVTPLASGSNGVLEFGVLTNNLTTPNNTALATNAELTATGGYTSGVKTNTMLVTAIPRICATKTLLNGGAVNNITTYRIALYPGWAYNWVPKGTLQPTNITITDNLPAGAQFVSAKVYNLAGTQVGTGTESGGVVTVPTPDMGFYAYDYTGTWQSQTYYVDIAVRFNTPTFSTGNVVVNNATVAYTPYSGTPTTLTNGQTVGTCTSDLTETTTLVAPVISAVLVKSGNGNFYPGNLIYYNIGFNNTGNVPLDNVEIIDSLPANIRVDQTASYRGVRFDAQTYLNHTEYQTNLNAAWVSFPPTGGYVVPLLPGGEYFTKIKFVLNSPFPANTALNGYNQIYCIGAYEPLVAETITNCVVWNSTSSGIPAIASRTTCNNSCVLQPRPATAKIYYYIRQSVTSCTPAIGSSISYTGTVVADAGYANATNPVCALLIPHGFQYLTHSFNAGTSGFTTAPTLQIIPNYITIGGIVKDMYRFTFPSGTVLPYSKNYAVTVQVAITAMLATGVPFNTDFIATATNSSINSPEYNYGNITDTNDWDLDGNTTEIIGRANSNYGGCDLVIPASASMESRKWVKGELDTDYSRYPGFGYTVQGGQADYKLIVKNTGNVAMKNIKIIDILPFVGDVGVIDPSVRNTQWRPNLAGPIAAPAGISVYYSTISNPCRDEIKQPSDPSPFPTGCVPPNWSLTPPLDITTVQAVKIDFGTKVLAAADSLTFNWPMRAPVDAPTSNQIAWNSFAFAATRSDNNMPLIPAEPIKVGIKVQAPSPGIYGDRVWLDLDHDGIQDAGEVGVSGVLVDLYRDNGDGISDINVDTRVDFTITDDDGNYLFPNLPLGNYFAHFLLPIGYTASPSDAGSNDLIDSDGLTTIVTTISAGENDRRWDLGLFTTASCTAEIYNFTVSECVYAAGSSQATINVFLAWETPPAGQTINVSVTGAPMQNINPALLSSPQLVSFQVPADGLVHTITAAYTGGCAGIASTRQFYAPTPCVTEIPSVMIHEVKTSLCLPDVGSGYALVDVWVGWENPPVGKDITVTVGGVTQTIDVINGALSPFLLTFTVPANGSTGNTIVASFAGTIYSDTKTYNAPASCAVGSVGNYVWNDTNGNGINDEGGTGINGVTVELWNATTNTLVSSTATANNGTNDGAYNFVITTNGNYYIKFPTANGGKILTSQTTTAGVDNNSDASISTGSSPTFTININGTGVAKDNMTIDAGYTCPGGCVPITVTKTN